MALVNLRDVRVSRLNNTGNGFTVLEENKSGDKTYKQYYKVWPKESTGVREGDIVSLSGFLGAKVSEWEDKDHVQRHSVELSINSPRIEGTTPAAETPAEPEGWYAAGPAVDETPVPF